ncbi:MAG: TldD/PmbA family protein [Bacteroidales bacterium]|nr:TldD/PmbA family protein [Bacteroidales bacterium]MDD4656321.1 TldD/PmbA family protein [Bacteroidales bacterium]
MIKMEQQEKEIAHKALEIALKQGCSQVRITLNSNTQSSYRVRDNNIDRIQQAKGSSLYIQLFNKGKYGSFSTNRTQESELENFIKNGAQATLLLTPDSYRSLPDKKLYYTGKKKNLNQYDKTVKSIDPSVKRKIAFEAATEIFNSDSRIISVNSEYGDLDDYVYIVDSQGFEGESKQSSFSLSCECSVKGERGSRPEGWWYETSLYFDSLVKKGVGKKAYNRAISMISPKKLKSGKYNMVLENNVSSRVVAPIISALNGASIQQNNSFLKGKIGEKVFNPNFQLSDSPHLLASFGSRYFDSEGIATKPMNIIEGGVVNTYFINTYYSKKLNIPVTIEGPSVPTCKYSLEPNTIVPNKDQAQILKECGTGVLVTGFNGGNSNSSTGDYSFGVEGFYFENGIILYPVKEMNITGNLITLWNNFVAAGTDPRGTSRWLIPTLAFEAVNFSGI